MCIYIKIGKKRWRAFLSWKSEKKLIFYPLCKTIFFSKLVQILILHLKLSAFMCIFINISKKMTKWREFFSLRLFSLLENLHLLPLLLLQAVLKILCQFLLKSLSYFGIPRFFPPLSCLKAENLCFCVVFQNRPDFGRPRISSLVATLPLSCLSSM